MSLFDPWRDWFRQILPKLNRRHKESPLQDILNKALIGSVKTTGALDLKGITLHYSADRDVPRTVASLIKAGLGYHYLIGRNGMIYPLAEDTHALAHAGTASWHGYSPNRHHVAICVMSWGKLTIKNGTLATWTGAPLPPEEVRTLGDGSQWDKATIEQEASLLRLLYHYTTERGVDPDHLCGHSECCFPKGRKSDPGGVLALPLPKIREMLSARNC